MNRLVIKIVWLFFLSSISTYILFKILSLFIESSEYFDFTEIITIEIIGLTLPIIYGLRQIKFVDIFNRKFNKKGYLQFSLSILAVISLLFITILLDQESSQKDQMEVFYYSKIGMIMIVLIVPILEEVFFRGVILTLLLKQLSVTRAILITSIFFGILHLGTSWNSCFTAIIFSITVSYLYISTESVLPCIALHIFNNGLVYILDYIDREYYAIPPSTGWYFIPVLIISIYYIRKKSLLQRTPAIEVNSKT